MKKRLIILSAIFLFVLFLGYPTKARAQLRSNLKDPGITRKSWLYYPNQNCFFGDRLWTLHSLSANETPCDGQVMGQNWSYVNGRYEVTLSLDNTKNGSNICNSETRVYYGLQAFPNGYKDVLYFNSLTSVRVRVTLKNSTLTAACDDSNNSVCVQHACPNTNWGTHYPDLALIIGIPMYDETNHRNLWLEISPYWTKNARYGGPPQDPNFGQYLFWGESVTEELQRIMITHPLVNQPVVNPGQTVTYDIDVLPIIKSLRWGRTQAIDWSRVHLSDMYVGVETWGWSLTNFTVSDLDFLYDDNNVTIFDIHQLLSSFSNIFDYNKLVGNFGK